AFTEDGWFRTGDLGALDENGYLTLLSRIKELIVRGGEKIAPREIDEMAAIDGWSFPAFFIRHFLPLVAGGVGVAAFFCFMFSWVELLLARTLTTVNAKPIVATMTRTILDLHERHPFDVLHAQYGYPCGLAVLRAARAAGLPAVVSVQGGDGHWVGTCCTTHRELIRAVFAAAPALLIGSSSF
ncbi:MAG: glycosyltransferase, partial [Gammaproteobacteria bacterium]